MVEKPKKATSLQNLFTLLAVVSATLALVLGMYIYLAQKVPQLKSDLEKEYIALKQEFTTLKTEFRKVENLALKAQLPGTELPTKQDINIEGLRERIKKVETDIQSLQSFKQLLFDDPEAAVTIPLIKKDIESLRQENKNLRDELDRTSGINRWFIGIMISIAVSILLLAIGVFARR